MTLRDAGNAAAPGATGADGQVIQMGVGIEPKDTAPVSPHPLLVLHQAPVADAILDALADAGVAVRGRCGFVRVPLRPPFPDGAVRCPICRALAAGEFDEVAS